MQAFYKQVLKFPILFASLLLGLGGHFLANAATASVQTVAKAASASTSSLSVSFAANTVAGDLIVVGFDYNTNATPSAVTDSQGNVFTAVGLQLTTSGGARSRVYYAKNIKGGADTVTITLSATSAWLEVYLSEYSGVDPANPIDAQVGASGSSAAVSSGSATTTVAGDVIYGYCVADATCTFGSGFTARSTLNNNLIEDKIASTAGTYSATGTANNGWTMQLVAFKPPSSTDTTPPSVPTGLSASAVSASQINLSWSASTDNVGVAGYHVFRNSVQIATTSGTSYTDSGLAASTTYSYTVNAFDAAGNVSAQSTSVNATTSPADTTPPSAPTNLSGTSPSSSQVNLSWGASTDNVGVAGYRVSRNSAQIATTSSLSYSDTGLTASTSYTYSITAFDAAGNVSAPSNSVSVTTQAANLSAAPLLKLSASGKYLVNSATNQPVFLTGEDAFLLSLQISNSDISTYLADRTSRGFNAIWMGVVDEVDQSNPPKDFSGNSPFDGAWFTSPDAAYWAHQDSVIQQAGADGIVVFLHTSFVGLNTASGDLSEILTSSNATMTAYGAFLGNRYKNYNNIVYVLGGDADPSISGLYSKLADIANGIKSVDSNHLITLEACRICSTPNQSTINAYGGTPPSFLNLNWVYNTEATVVAGCQAGYASSSSSIPPLMGEDWYELEHSVTAFQARQEGYWEILSGCYLGRMFGNGPIWSFNSTHGGSTTPSWESELGSGGSVGQQYLGKLMRSREHWLMAPDTTHSVLTAGFGSGSTLSVAARSTDGQTIIAYFSDGNATAKTISMSKITSASSTAKSWWYNPQTGAATLIASFPNSGSQSFTAPDGNDWVLVIDDASANLPAPGTGTLSINPGTAVTNLSCSPNALSSGASSTCAVTLSQAAPSGGATIALTNSNSSALSVPAAVTAPSGASATSFVAKAASLTMPQTATVTATLGSSSSSDALSLQAPVSLTSLACSPTILVSGMASACTVMLNQPAPSGGATVTFTDTNTSAVVVPASVVVSSGATTANFSVTAAVVTASQSATITANLGTSSQSISLTVTFVDTTPPSVSITAPTAGQTVSGTITVSANASDNVAVAWVQFRVDGVAVGPQDTTSPYSYSLVTTSLTNATHTITAVASDTSGNTTTSAVINFTVNNSSSKPISFVQIMPKAASAASSSISLSFSSNTVAGDFLIVGFDYDTNSAPSSVTDSQGNLFTPVGSQLITPGGARSRVYYAKNIKGGADTVTITLSATSAWLEVYLSEYSGVDPANPIDAQIGASGTAGVVSSGAASTTAAADLIYGYCVGDWACTVGSGFIARSTFNNNLIEDQTSGTAGTYSATGSASKGWTMQLVALKKAQ
jgi:chitodextrinase